MKEVKATPIANLIKKGIAASISYTEYKEKISALLATGMSTGKEQSEALTNYSMLNERRMKRLDKTLVIDQAIGAAIAEMEVDSTWLVITEGWCGDAAQSLPVLNKIAASSPGIDLRIVFGDQHLDLMDNFLTNKGRSIPKLIALFKNGGTHPFYLGTKTINSYQNGRGF
ncbi:thioredoxin family protein [Tritonibacter mobilis]|nr:thioredoxin family protein [Tritonibacter mobilis]